MTQQQHPITPPPQELLRKWSTPLANHEAHGRKAVDRETYIATKAAKVCLATTGDPNT